MSKKQNKPKEDYISFSAFKLYNECPFSYKLKYIDKIIKSDANIFTAFGKAIHESIQEKLLKEQINEKEFFVNCYREELKEISKEIYNTYDKDFVLETKQQGENLVSLFKPFLDKRFKNYKVVSIEEEILQKIERLESLKDKYFYGFVDLIIQDLETNKYYIFDLKTSNIGWIKREKSEKLRLYQLIFYKYFWSKKHNIDLENIETEFVILKRTVKKDYIEFFRVTSGNKRIENALILLANTCILINKKVFPKDLFSCPKCYYKKYCKKII